MDAKFRYDNLQQAMLDRFTKWASKIVKIDAFIFDPVYRKSCQILQKCRVFEELKIKNKNPSDSEFVKSEKYIKTNKNILYICEPSESGVDTLRDHILNFSNAHSTNFRFLVGFAPMQTAEVDAWLGDHLFHSCVTYSELDLGFFAFAHDVYLADCPGLFTTAFLWRDMTWPYKLGEMLAQLIRVGLPNVPDHEMEFFAYGDAAEATFRGVYAQMTGEGRDGGGGSDGGGGGGFGGKSHGSTKILLFSRDLDYISTSLISANMESYLHEIDDFTYIYKMNDKDLDINNIDWFQKIRDLTVFSAHSRQSYDIRFLREERQKFDQKQDNIKIEDLRNITDNVIPVKRKMDSSFELVHKALQTFLELSNRHDQQRVQSELLVAAGREQNAAQSALSNLTSSATNQHGLGGEYDELKSLVKKLLSGEPPGEEMIRALNLCVLATQVFNGLPAAEYRALSSAVCQALGFGALNWLHNLRRLKLFAPRSDFTQTATSSSTSSTTSASTTSLASSAAAGGSTAAASSQISGSSNTASTAAATSNAASSAASESGGSGATSLVQSCSGDKFTASVLSSSFGEPVINGAILAEMEKEMKSFGVIGGGGGGGGGTASGGASTSSSTKVAAGAMHEMMKLFNSKRVAAYEKVVSHLELYNPSQVETSMNFIANMPELQKLPLGINTETDKRFDDRIDCSFVFNGYFTPIIAGIARAVCSLSADQIVHHTINPTAANSGTSGVGRGGKQDPYQIVCKTVRHLRKAMLDLGLSQSDANRLGQQHLQSGTSVREKLSNASNCSSKIENLVVCMVGGLCYSEMNSLRFLAVMLRAKRLIVLTDQMLTSKDLISQAGSA